MAFLEAHGLAQAQCIAKAEATVISNFAWQHMHSAILFYRQVQELERRFEGQPLGAFWEDIRSYSSGCFLVSAAALEALVNEFYLAHNSPLRKKIENFENEFWGKNKLESKPALIKYQRALKILELAEMDINDKKFVNAEAVIGLRNSLIHFKPNWDGLREREADLVDRLMSKYELSKFATGDFVTINSMSASACEWAIRSVFDFIREFCSRTHIDDQKMEGFWILESKFKSQ